MDSNAIGIYVKILDKEFQISCPKGAESQLSEAAVYLDEKMYEIKQSGKVVGTERIAVMAALNAVHEMLSHKRETEEYIAITDSRIKKLHDRIEQTLINKETRLETSMFD